MSSCVLDASALLAYIDDEPGAELVREWLGGDAVISAVNWAEVLSTEVDRGGNAEELIADLANAGVLGQSLEVQPFRHEDAPLVARLRPLTRAWGLSLADRACIALAQRLELPAVTTDRAWGEASLPVRVELVR